jgi:predicted ATP-dependent endonuclease of OLD family
MIKSVKLLKGQDTFTNKLYNHKSKDVVYTFTDGVNIINGRNASGKSVLLKIIKYNCGIISKESTYPTMIHPSELHGWNFSDDKWKTIPEIIKERLKNVELPKSKIEWDGSMVHYLIPDHFNADNIWKRLDSPYQTEQGELFSGIEALSMMFSKNSEGEGCVRLLNRLYNLSDKYDEPLDTKRNNDMWIKASDIYQEWITSFTKKGKPTLLIDELDNHLDLDNQKMYWDYLGNLTKKWQVIVVSHSIFAFKQTNVNYISLNPEYFDKVVNL